MNSAFATRRSICVSDPREEPSPTPQHSYRGSVRNKTTSSRPCAIGAQLRKPPCGSGVVLGASGGNVGVCPANRVSSSQIHSVVHKAIQRESRVHPQLFMLVPGGPA